MSSARTRSRQLAMQGIYEWQMSDNSLDSIVENLLEGPNTSKIDKVYLDLLLKGIIAKHSELDEKLQPCLDRPIADLDMVEKAILRLAAYEFSYCPEVPYKVVINEGVELAKKFGAEKGHKFVNGVLDKLAASLRSLEFKARNKA